MSQHFADARNMPMNNNASQKAPSAAVRLAKLPIVSSACAKFSVLYLDTKRSHPCLKSVCDVLENGVATIGTVACHHVSPVIGKLEPQITFANGVACRSLDWLETAFPVLHTPVEQIAARTRNKVLEIQGVVSIVVNGTVDCAKYTVTWAMNSAQQKMDRGRNMADDGANQSLVVRAISVANVGLDSALSKSEALVDQMLPPSEDDREEVHVVQGFEATTFRSGYCVRLVSLTTKLCRRTYHEVGTKLHSAQVMESLLRSPDLVQYLQTSLLTLAWLPQYLQHQALTVVFFFCQMYNLSYPPSKQNPSDRPQSSSNTAKALMPRSIVPYVHMQAPPDYRMRKPLKAPPLDNGCNAKGCMHR